jgi:hypothetical protein
VLGLQLGDQVAVVSPSVSSAGAGAGAGAAVLCVSIQPRQAGCVERLSASILMCHFSVLQRCLAGMLL